jgi:hypothetical protein
MHSRTREALHESHADRCNPRGPQNDLLGAFARRLRVLLPAGPSAPDTNGRKHFLRLAFGDPGVQRLGCGCGAQGWRFSLWQKGFYDHVLRSGESTDGAAWYVFMNPVRAGLVKRAQDWPYSGSFVFRWAASRHRRNCFSRRGKAGRHRQVGPIRRPDAGIGKGKAGKRKMAS